MKNKIFFLAILSLAINTTFAKTTICEGVYALCAYAKCIPIPGQKNKALCSCEAKSGYSIGNKSCQTKSVINSDGYETLESRYFPVKSYVSCKNNRPWANCYNAKCIVDPQNKNQAYCTCTTTHSKKAYMAASDSCDTNGCDVGIISSFVIEDAVKEFASLKTVTNYDKLPGYTPELCQK